MGWDDDTHYPDQTFDENRNTTTGWDDDIYYTDEAFTTTDFDRYYLSYPLSNISKTHLESGNKIIMPASALDHLASLEIVYPMLFRIENTYNGHHSYCGVVEFTAEEGFVFMPTWMMDNMDIVEGELVNIKNTSLPKGNYIKIQPHTTEFTNLLDHKSILENSFRNFACLTAGDTIVINYGEEKYKIDILETKPSPAVSMFETDCEVDFALPLDYKEPTKVDLKRKSNDNEYRGTCTDEKVNMFPGVGRRLDGTKVVKDDECCLSALESMKKLKIKDDLKVGGAATRVKGQPLEAKEVLAKEEHGFKVFTGKSYNMLG